VVLDFLTPHTGQPVLLVHLLLQLAVYVECPRKHTQRHFLGLLFDTYLTGRQIAWVTLLEKPRVLGHRLALTKIALPPSAFTEGADYVAPILRQIQHPGLPFVVSAASVEAAWAAQP